MLLSACLFLLQAAPSGPSSAGDTAGWLEKLRAPTAVERASAQRWLARHLAPGDLGALRAAALAGDAESRRRLSLALADDDAHVALAVSLASDKDGAVSEVGREALAERLARWCPAWARQGIDRASVRRALHGKSDRPIAIEARTQDKRLDVALDQLARFGPGAPPLVLDPDLALSDHPRETPADSSGVLEGPFEQVLDELVRVHRADLEAFALAGDADGQGGEGPQDLDAELDGPLRPWIRVRRSVAAENRSAVDRIVDWCLEIARSPDSARRSACARALASTAWPGGIAWLEERALVAKDDAALDGLLLAAGRGQVAPSLMRPDVVPQLLARIPRALEGAGGAGQDPSRADRIARALAAVGPFGPKGEDLAAIVARDLEGLPPREMWLRLVVLEGMRSPSSAAAAAVEATLKRGGIPPPLRFQAMRARLAMPREPGTSPALAGPGEVLAWADRAGKASECVEGLVDLRVPAPAVGADSAAEIARSPTLRLSELEWSFFGADPSGAPGRLVRLAAPQDRGGLGLESLAERTRIWVRQGAASRLDAALLAARSLPGADPERLERLQLLSGSGSEDLEKRWIARLAGSVETRGAREDLLCLAAMAATEADARAALVRALASKANLEDVAAALELAVDVLRAARLEDDERAFVKAVGDAAREATPGVRSRFRADAWPPHRTAEPIRAEDRDRSLDHSGL